MCAVYVDDMWKFPMGRYRGMKMSHMLADTDTELFAMADRLKLRSDWYQNDHFDISLTKRAFAVKYGAIEITVKEAAAIRWCKRFNRMYRSPAEARQLMLDYIAECYTEGLNVKETTASPQALGKTRKR